MEHHAFSTVARLSGQLSRQGLTSVLLTTFFLKRIEKYNPTLHAFAAVFGEQALQDAKASDARRRAGQPLSLLDGIPLAIRHSIGTGAMVRPDVSFGHACQGRAETAALVQRLRGQGAIVMGITPTTEFTPDGLHTSMRQGVPGNPWDTNYARSSGGSAGGLAAVVAAGLAPCAVGTDTGGSIRIAAAFCSLTGLKITTEQVDMSGVLSAAPLLESVGLVTHTAEDAAIVYRALTCEPGAQPDESGHRLLDDGDGLEGMTLALMPDEQYDTDVQRAVRLGVRDMVRMAEMAGARVVRERPPLSFDRVAEQSRLLMAACGWREHAAMMASCDLPADSPACEWVLAGQAVSQMQYEDLLGAHQAAISTWQTWMADKDAFMTPTVPMIAPLLSDIDEHRSPAFFTHLANWTGTCALALPAGFDPGNLPVSAQLVGKPQDERRLLQVGSVIQCLTAWHSYSPTLND